MKRAGRAAATGEAGGAPSDTSWAYGGGKAWTVARDGYQATDVCEVDPCEA